MATIINLTPHEITLYATRDCIEVTKNGYKSLVLKKGAKPMAIYPSQSIARVTSFKELQYTINSVPVYTTEFGKVEGLPEPAHNVYYIVSALTAQAVKGRRDVLIGDGAVRDNEGRIVGCTAFGRL